MAICKPEHPVFKSSAEQQVWERLRADLPDHAYLLSNVALTDDEGDYEADFVVVWPGIGVANIEVKGGLVQRHSQDYWTSLDGKGELHEINPPVQISRNHRVIARYVESHWSRGKVKFAGMAVFPHTDLPPDFDPPELRRNRIIDKAEMSSLRERLIEVCRPSQHAFADGGNCSAFVSTLLASRDSQKDFVSLKPARAAMINQWTSEQKNILDAARSVPQFKVVGPAGSGKTYLALEQTRRLSSQGKEIALVCFSHGLARYLARVTETWPEGQRPAFVGMFHELAAKIWKIKAPVSPTPHWYDVESLEQMLAYLKNHPTARLFDGFVVDEGQDMTAKAWDVMHAATRVRAETAPLCVFGDEEQRIFGGQGFGHLPVLTLELTKNLRSTAPIADLVGEFPKQKPEHSQLPGPDVLLIPATFDRAISAANEEVERLLGEGWSPGDVLVLTTKNRHEKHQTFRDEDKDAYWKRFFDDEVFYAHVNGIKGLERPVVVLAVDGWQYPERAREFLYVGLSRARDLLVICGQAEEIRRVGGDRVWEKLKKDYR